MKEPFDFEGFSRNFIVRKSTYIKKTPESIETNEADQSLEITDILMFNVLKQKHFLFQGYVWKPHECLLELVEGTSLWQITCKPKRV